MKKRRNGFTLIELLAVIIILGILMIIAIPSVTSYINNSRKSAYVDTVKQLVASARNMVNEGKLEMYDTTASYYIPASCINTENGGKSPYGEFQEAYVIVTFDGKGYNYYWISRDETGQGVKEITNVDELKEESIKSDIVVGDVKPVPVNSNKSKVLELNASCDSFTGLGIANYNGKTKDTVDVGDKVTIGTEEFFVIKPLTDGKLTLLSRYNLNVGNNKKAGATEGLQDSEVKGWLSSGTKYGTIAFSSTNYWNGKVGEDLDYPKNYCTSDSGTECAYVYYDKNKNIDSANTISTYLDAYKEALIEMGQPVEEARLLRVEEAFELDCITTPTFTCDSAPDFVRETSYWLGSASDSGSIWRIYSDGRFNSGNYTFGSTYGVRPVIII